MKQAHSFDDVLLVPQYSDIESRGQIDISNSLNNKISLAMPVISSPMDTITEDEMAATMATCGGMGIVHRYNSLEEQVRIVAKAKFKNESATLPPTSPPILGFLRRAYTGVMIRLPTEGNLTNPLVMKLIMFSVADGG